MQILGRIEACYPVLTKKQKQLADYMKNHVEAMSFITLKELSNEVGITEITILNMCKALGYESFNEVKYEFRKYINQNRVEVYQDNEYYGMKIPEYELAKKESLLWNICQEEKSLMVDMVKNIDCQKVFEAAQLFGEYPKILLCGRGMSFLLCEWLKTYLTEEVISTIPVNTELNESVYAALPAIDKRTLVVVFSFPDYYFMTQKIAEYAQKQKAKVLAITDTAEALIADVADIVLTAPSTTRLAMNTLSAPMALVNILASAVKIIMGQKKRHQTEEFGRLFDDKL